MASVAFGTFTFVGTYVTKLLVRRIPKCISKHRQSKVLSLGNASLKFKLSEISENISGYRMIYIETLQHHLMENTTHSRFCEEAQQLVAEGKILRL